MGTLIGIMIGVTATILVARYYFNKSTNKQISVFVTLSNRVFAGIEQEVRERLSFHYEGVQINELQQVDLIIANDGDRAIRDCIEPLTLRFKKKTKILDAAIIHREPADLEIKISQDRDDEIQVIRCEFPLLNAGEFFMLKLLLDGYIQRSDIECHILVDDVNRSFPVKLLPRSAVTEAKRKIEWFGIASGSFFLLVAASFFVVIRKYYALKPSIFPYPWAEFQPSWVETPSLIIATLGIMIFVVTGVAMIIGIGFEEFLTRHPRFPLPEELRGRSYRFPYKLLTSGVFEELPEKQNGTNKGE